MSPQVVYDKHSLSDVRSITGQTTEIKDNTNTHWSKASNTKEWGRLFIFEWYISGITKPIRWAAWRLLNERINIEPYLNADPYKKLEFQTDEWEDRWVMAKVNKAWWEQCWIHPRIEFSLSCLLRLMRYMVKSWKPNHLHQVSIDERHFLMNFLTLGVVLHIIMFVLMNETLVHDVLSKHKVSWWTQR